MDNQVKWALGAIGGVLGAVGLARAMQPSNIAIHAYEITPEDLIWLKRAVEHEGAPQESVANTLINLFTMLWTLKHSKFRDLKTLVQAYASPVNPSWFPSGQKHIKYAAGLSGAALANENVAAQRRQDVYSVQTSFSPSTELAVANATKDGTSFEKDWTDYAAPHVNASSRYTRRTEPETGVNTFYTRSPGWPGYLVHGNILVQA